MTEIFRMFRLGLDLDYEEDYKQIGYTNFTQSMALEPGTLAMYGGHLSEDFSQQIVVECYASEEAYQEHVQSPHFKAFVDLAQKALTSREVVTLVPQLLLQKPTALRIFDDKQLAVRLATVKVSDSNAFSEIVLPEMQTSMEKEAGVLVMYAGTDVDNPDTWYFFEVYQNETAYEQHRETPHFKDYIEQSAKLVLDKQLQTLHGDMLVNRG
ncbi:putative quinol monooxygenase [Streptococcus sp. S784/96/1]|uniref:putative quinol monooxygenase n=1 Tax=Streptococcus sp. S784/96/1 TaxID=2653499 RepID=UPI00138A2669|nr:antibiotic biosynthesis monooxygenase [Streptococcus sp. S784/96/1]